jgi:hypothetical protein
MKDRDGFALEATPFVLVLMSVLMLSAYTGAAMATGSSNLDYRASRVSYAAEAGADAIMAQLADALEDGYVPSPKSDVRAEPQELRRACPTFSICPTRRVGEYRVGSIGPTRA